MDSSLVVDCSHLATEIRAAARTVMGLHARNCKLLAHRIARLEPLLSELELLWDDDCSSGAIAALEFLRSELQDGLCLVERCREAGRVRTLLEAGRMDAAFEAKLLSVRTALLGLEHIGQLQDEVRRTCESLGGVQFEAHMEEQKMVADIEHQVELARAGVCSQEDVHAEILEMLLAWLPNGLTLENCEAEVGDLQSVLVGSQPGKDRSQQAFLSHLIGALQLQQDRLKYFGAARLPPTLLPPQQPPPPPPQHESPLETRHQRQQQPQKQQDFHQAGETSRPPELETRAAAESSPTPQQPKLAPPTPVQPPAQLAVGYREASDASMPSVERFVIGAERLVDRHYSSGRRDSISSSSVPSGRRDSISSSSIPSSRRDSMSSLPSSRRDSMASLPSSRRDSMASLPGSRRDSMASQRSAASQFGGMRDAPPLAESSRAALEEELHHAAVCGSVMAASQLLACGAAVDSRDMQGRTPLLHAVKGGHTDVVHMLLRQGADGCTADSFGSTALHLAAMEGHAHLVGLLLQATALDVNQMDCFGAAPLRWAVANSHAHVVKLLLDAGADVNIPHESGKTELHLAAIVGNDDIAHELVIRGADLEATDDGNWTPLHWAAARRHAEVADVLVRAGANMAALDLYGRVPGDVVGALEEDPAALADDGDEQLAGGGHRVLQPMDPVAEAEAVGMGPWDEITPATPLSHSSHGPSAPAYYTQGTHAGVKRPGSRDSLMSESSLGQQSGRASTASARSTSIELFSAVEPAEHQTQASLNMSWGRETASRLLLQAGLDPGARLLSTGDPKLDRIFERLAAPGCKGVSLDLSGLGIGVDATKVLAMVLLRSTSLQAVHFRGNSPSPLGVTFLAAALKADCSLTSLDLSDCDVGVDGAWALAEALLSNTNLRTLKLTHAGIGRKGATAIAESLKTNGSLVRLEMNSNGLGPASGAALAEMLRSNTSLEVLDLQHNRLGEEGVQAIAEACEFNVTLRELKLASNELPFFIPKPIKQIFSERKKALGLLAKLK